MSQKHYPLIAKEGCLYFGLSLIVALGATYFFGLWSLLFWLGFLFVLLYFRDPKRKVTHTQGAIASPASGTIVALEECDNPYLPGVKSLKISIFMKLFSVHSNLIPITGKVENLWYFEGKYLHAALAQASNQNERNALHILTEQGKDVVCVQIAGRMARRIFCYVRQGDMVKVGQRFGFIRFGSRVDLYLPLGSQLHVKLGQKVTSGNTQLAQL